MGLLHAARELSVISGTVVLRKSEFDDLFIGKDQVNVAAICCASTCI